MTTKIYLFYPSSLKGYFICLVTLSRFSHAAVEVRGVLYDSSESRGYFGESQIDTSTRRYEVWELEGSLIRWRVSMRGKKYDWKGVIGWIFGAGSKNKFYCFETAWSALAVLGHVPEEIPNRVSGKTIRRILDKIKGS